MQRLIRVLRSRAFLLCLIGLVLGGFALRYISRVGFVSDLGSGGKVSVRFTAPSPWFSGTKAFVQFDSSETMRSPGVICGTTTFYQDNVTVHKGVSVIFDARPGQETTVGEFLKEFERRIDRDDFPIPVLEHGDPSTVIGGNFPEPQRTYFTPDWKLFTLQQSRFWIPGI